MKEIFKSLFSEFWDLGLPEIKARDLSLPLRTSKIVMLNGVKRCGKTFLLYEAIKNLIKTGYDPKYIVFLSFSDERIDCQVEDLDQILDAHFEIYADLKVSEIHFFFDDIQRIEGWETFIMRLYDQVSQHIYIASPNLEAFKNNPNPKLQQHSIVLQLYPLNWNEFCQWHDVSSHDLSTLNQAKLQRHFNRFLTQGGFPELNFTETRYHRQKLTDLLHLTLMEDLISKYETKNTTYLKILINKIFQNNGSPTSVHKIYNDIKDLGYKCSKTAIYNIIEQMQAIQLFQPCLKYDKDISKSLQAEKKLYAIDHSLLDLYDFNNTHAEKKLESLIFSEIRKQTEHIWYFKQGHSTDFIGKWRGRWNAIQVSWALNDNETIQRELKNLIKTCSLLDIHHGYVITRSTDEQVMLDDIEIQMISATNFLESHTLFARA